MMDSLPAPASDRAAWWLDAEALAFDFSLRFPAQVPICLVSLVDKERQWFKSVQGITATQTDRRSSFCAWCVPAPSRDRLLTASC